MSKSSANSFARVPGWSRASSSSTKKLIPERPTGGCALALSTRSRVHGRVKHRYEVQRRHALVVGLGVRLHDVEREVAARPLLTRPSTGIFGDVD